VLINKSVLSADILYTDQHNFVRRMHYPLQYSVENAHSSETFPQKEFLFIKMPRIGI